MSEEQNRSEAWDLAQAILRYLERRPEARDSVDGIARWWIQHEWSERMLANVEEAIALLRSRGLVIETRRRGMPPIYQLNRERWDAIMTILQTPKHPTEG